MRKAEWYIVQCRRNYELKVKAALENRIVSENVKDDILEVFVPMMTTITKTNKYKQTCMYSGYVYVLTTMTDEAWYVIRNTTDVTGLVGSSGQGTKPTPIPKEKMDEIIQKTHDETKSSDDGYLSFVNFKVGDTVEIIKGTFLGQQGKVLDINIDKQLCSVEIEVFNRLTPTTVNLIEVKKI